MNDSSTIIVLLTVLVALLTIVIVSLLVAVIVLIARVNRIAKNVETVSTSVVNATEWVDPKKLVSFLAGFFGSKRRK